MKGFDPEFKNLEDYILKITHRIWEEKGLHKIPQWYAQNAKIYTPSSITKTSQSVTQSTLETLNMFPDRELLGEAVINEEVKTGLYYSSHRIFSNMTHRGNGIYGPATGKLVKVRTIADCLCQNNKVIEEWLVRDQSAILKNLGVSSEKFGKTQGIALKQSGSSYRLKEMLKNWAKGPRSKLALKKSKLIKRIARGLESIWQENNFSIIDNLYQRAAISFIPGGKILNGTREIRQFFNGWISSFPDAQFKIHHFIENHWSGNPFQIALRWTVSGTHSGWGYFGRPTGSPILIMAISHLEIRDNQIYQDFHLIDEISLWGQIAFNQKN